MALRLDRIPSTNAAPPEYAVEIKTMIAAKQRNAAAEVVDRRNLKNAEIDAIIAAKAGAYTRPHLSST
jgi:leucyl aminopeptidase